MESFVVASIFGRAIFKTCSSYDYDSFRHPILSKEQNQNGARLGIDTWADTACAGQHAFVEEFVVDKMVTASGFTQELGSLTDLPVANVLYAYDTSEGETLILESNNAIYLGDKMEDSLMNPIQAEEIGVRIDTRPQRYYPDIWTSQSISFPDGTVIKLKYDGVLPFIPIRRPTQEEVHNCRRFPLNSRDSWDPFLFDGNFSMLQQDFVPDYEAIFASLHCADPISTSLLSHNLHSVVSTLPILSPRQSQEEKWQSQLAAITSARSDLITPEELSKKWHIGLDVAARTLKATTHQFIRTTGALTKRFRTDKAQLRYKRLMKLFGSFYCDYLKSDVKSIRGYIGGVIYTNRLAFYKFVPCSTETSAETGRSLRHFLHFVGLPYSLHSDNHNNFKEGLFKQILRKFGVPQTFTEPHSPWQNRAEPAIGEIKRYARRIMMETQTPIRLWCFCYEYTADLLSLLAIGRFDLQGRTPYEVVMQYTPDISEYVSFTWFQWCWYHDEATKTKRICRWLGPAHQTGQSFCSYIILSNAQYIARSTVIPIPLDELKTDEMRERTSIFMNCLNEKIGNSMQASFNIQNSQEIYYTNFGDDVDDDNRDLPYGIELIDIENEEINEPYLESLDQYINIQVALPNREGIPVLAKVKKRKRDSSGNPIGEPNENPILDTRIYELEFPDGATAEYSVNTISENLFNQAGDNGWDTGIFSEIVGLRKDDAIAIPRSKGTITSNNGQTRNVITTKGWEAHIKWQDQSTSWLPLNVVKESYPVELAEFAYANGFEPEPAFKWWTRHVLRHRDRMISRLKTMRHRKGRMKFGIQIPGTVEEALKLDNEAGNKLWQTAIEKEWKNSRVAFKLLERGQPPPVGFKEITCHLIFDLKLDMTRKARYVAGGHLTDVPTHMTYSSVVGRETVRIGMLMAALNGLELLAGDIQNAFLEAPTKENIFFYAGDEWKADEGRVVVVVRALYGLKSSALQFRKHLAETLGNRLGFKPSLADPDLWFKPMSAKDGFKYYAYILVYVDDILIIDKTPMRFMDMINEKFKVKPDSIAEPTSYLGADLRKVQYQDGSYAWVMGSANYVDKVVKNVKKTLEKYGFEYNRKLSDVNYSPKQPFTTVSYRPELDTSMTCNPNQVTFYQNLIGILRWVVELGRIDIAYEVSKLSSYLVEPRTGHILQAIHIFKYLDIHKDNELALDPKYQYFELPGAIAERKKLMKEMYPDAKEELPLNAPEPRGNSVQINCFVDSDHAGDKITRRSQTGILLYCNSAPIVWYSKRQSTCETSTFGSEFVALRIATELVISIRYKLRMFGIPIQGEANMFCDNEAVYRNSSFAESTLKKKHNSICFHRVRENVAAGVITVVKVESGSNLSDMLTKSLPGPQRKYLRSLIMYCEA